MRQRNPVQRAACGVAAALVFALPALAGEHGRAWHVAPLPEYTQECTACHVAYPPGMLPAASWQRVISTLPHHYGTDASLDATVQTKLTAWVTKNAGTYKRVSEAPPEDRITRSPWFVREHREVSATTWKLPAVKSASNCAACHRDADVGDFSEHSVRVPG
jgi:hypothetical protein